MSDPGLLVLPDEPGRHRVDFQLLLVED